jgi:hypothetical protein
MLKQLKKLMNRDGVDPYLDYLRSKSGRWNPGKLLECLPVIVQSGLIDQRAREGLTLLSAAVVSQKSPSSSVTRESLVTALLEAGADPLLGRLPGPHGGNFPQFYLPLMGALSNGWTKTAQLLHSFSHYPSELEPWMWVFAVSGGHPAAMQQLQQWGVKIGTGLESGLPLWGFAHSLASMQELRSLAPSLPLDLSDVKNGWTDAHRQAVLFGSGPEAMARLKAYAEWGLDLNHRDRHQSTMLHLTLGALASKRPVTITSEILDGIRFLRESGLSLHAFTQAQNAGKPSSGFHVLARILANRDEKEQALLLGALNISSAEWLTPLSNGEIPLAVVSPAAPRLASSMASRIGSQEAELAMYKTVAAASVVSRQRL